MLTIVKNLLPVAGWLLLACRANYSFLSRKFFYPFHRAAEFFLSAVSYFLPATSFLFTCNSLLSPFLLTA